MQSPSQHQSNHNFQNSYFRFMYAIKSPETKKRYPDRFKAFLDYIQISVKDIEERRVNFYNAAKQNLPWLQNSLMNFFIFQKERVLNGEIAALTISNYYKPIKLFCDLNDILINWKFISSGISKEKHASDDRAPNIEEINQLLKYPDIRIKPIVLFMVSSGIRIAEWDYLKWKHLIPIENEKGMIIVVKVIVMWMIQNNIILLLHQKHIMP
jgi:integrase